MGFFLEKLRPSLSKMDEIRRQWNLFINSQEQKIAVLVIFLGILFLSFKDERITKLELEMEHLSTPGQELKPKSVIVLDEKYRIKNFQPTNDAQKRSYDLYLASRTLDTEEIVREHPLWPNMDWKAFDTAEFIEKGKIEWSEEGNCLYE